MKKTLSLLLALCLALSLTACGGSDEAPQEAEPVELSVFAAASLQESLDRIIADYEAAVPGVTVLATYDSSGTLLRQIQEGAPCDLFLSAALDKMDALEEEGALLEGSRRELLENKVVLAVPEGNPAGLESFDQLAEHLPSGELLLAMGNSDVPVGRYTLNLFEYYGLSEADLSAAGALTYGSNVKEVTTQVAEATVDCGVIYATDAFSAGLAAVDQATPEMCGQVLYPAAVPAASHAPEEALAFLQYLESPEGGLPRFEEVGFSPAP